MKKLVQPLLEFKEVYFSYIADPVLKNVNFEIYPGEYVAIVGPNGGGKTTLLKLITKALVPNSGSVHLFPNEKNPLHLVSYVPQTHIFDKAFPISVLEVVLQGILHELSFFGLFSEKQKKKAKEALSSVGMEAFSERVFGTLSLGQAQRVLIARALVSDPKLLLLDEPTASVDPQAEEEIYALIQKLRKDKAILMVTHDLKAAMREVDRVLFVQREVYSMQPEALCGHFAIGLYHPPFQRSEK